MDEQKQKVRAECIRHLETEYPGRFTKRAAQKIITKAIASGSDPIEFLDQEAATARPGGLSVIVQDIDWIEVTLRIPISSVADGSAGTHIEFHVPLEDRPTLRRIRAGLEESGKLMQVGGITSYARVGKWLLSEVCNQVASIERGD